MISTPVALQMAEMVIWPIVPEPEEPMVSLPGSRRAASITSPKLFQGLFAFTTMSTVPAITRVTPFRSRSGSSGIERRYRCLFPAMSEFGPIIIV